MQAFLRNPRNILPVDKNRLTGRINQPLQKMKQSRFSAAGHSDNPDFFPAFNFKAETVNRHFVGGIGKSQIAKLNFSLRNFQFSGAGNIFNFRFCVQKHQIILQLIQLRTVKHPNPGQITHYSAQRHNRI